MHGLFENGKDDVALHLVRHGCSLHGGCSMVNAAPDRIRYSPLMFANTFVEVNKLKKEELNMGFGTLLATWLLSFIESFGIWYVMQLFKVNDLQQAIKIGFACWLILVMPSHTVHYLYDGRPFKSLLLTNGHHLVDFVGSAIAMHLTLKYY